MKPATEPTVAFAESNSFALALLGLEAQARRIDRALPRSPSGAATVEPLIGASGGHPLDLALLGLISLAARLDTLGDSVAPPNPATELDLGLLR